MVLSDSSVMMTVVSEIKASQEVGLGQNRAKPREIKRR